MSKIEMSIKMNVCVRVCVCVRLFYPWVLVKMANM